MKSEPRHRLSPFGVQVKLKLMEQSKTQNWLISEIKERCPNAFVDSSSLNRVLTGRIRSGAVVSAIREILNIETET